LNDVDDPFCWRYCADPFDFYEVSDTGQVRRIETGKLNKSSLDSNGYETYWLENVDGEYQSVRAHILVAAAWLGPCPDGYHVHHRDENKRHNTPGNLVYLSPEAHRAEHGPTQIGESAAAAILTEVKVLTIRALDDAGAYRKFLAILFGVAPQTISDVCNRRQWKHI